MIINYQSIIGVDAHYFHHYLRHDDYLWRFTQLYDYLENENLFTRDADYRYRCSGIHHKNFEKY